MAHKTKKPNKKKGTWFYRVRGSYLPASTMGWLTYVPFIGYLAFTYIVGIKDISRAWVAILFIIANWIAATAMMTVLATRTS